MNRLAAAVVLCLCLPLSGCATQGLELSRGQEQVSTVADPQACEKARRHRERARELQVMPLNDPRFGSATGSDGPDAARSRRLQRSREMQREYARAWVAAKECSGR